MGKKKNIMKGVKKAVRLANKVARAAGINDPGAAAGSAVGRRIGKKLGHATAGENIGRFIGSALGKGDYVVNSNSLGKASRNLGAQVPTFSRNQESTIIEHREYIGDLISSSVSGEFKLDKYTFNPGNAQLFPWLNQIAKNYEQYEPLGAIVSFKSTSAEFNASGQTLGTVIIASDYDVYDALYTNKVEMENSTFAVSCKTSENMLHPIECDPKQRATRLLYNGPPANVSDRRFHDLCNVQIASVGVGPTDVNLGEIWITYRIRLHKPQLAGDFSGALIANFTNSDNTSTLGWYAVAPTFDPDSANNLVGKVAFNNIAAGQPRIMFTDPTTWGKSYMVTFYITTDNAAASAWTFQASAVDAQTQVHHTDTTNGSQILNGSSMMTNAIFSINKDPTAISIPGIVFPFTYTATNIIAISRIVLSQIDSDQIVV